jgi:maltose alpha-D-glucosyltransferase/alpha-amylase
VVANFSRLAQHTDLNLSEMSGETPVEVFGQTEFPTIGDTPYAITLSPYSFYWFSLESRQPEKIDLSTAPAKATVPTLTLAGEWENLYKREKKPSLEAALLDYVKQRRWFASKTRRSVSSEIEDVITIPYDTRETHLVLFKVEYSEGESDTYLLPISFALEKEAGEFASEFPQAVIAHLKLRGKDGEREGIIYDAVIDQRFHEALLRAMSRRRRLRGEKGEMVASYTNKVFRRPGEPAQEALESSLLSGEQSNTSVVYGDRFKLKLFRRLEEGVSPELELGRFLTEKEPFSNTAPVAGVIEYKTRWREPVTLGILHGYVRNEGDAWQYTVDSLGRYFERVLAQPGMEAPIPSGPSLLDIINEEVPPIVTEAIGPYLVSAQLLGQRTAELHLALASAVDEPNFVPELFSVTYQRSLCHSMRSFAIQVLQLLRQRLRYLPDDAKAEAVNVLNREDDIIERFEEIPRRKITGMRIRCHGDYHLGQVLYTGNDFVIVDFEGEPARRLGERRIKRSPLRDVAAMIRSFHYAAYVALHGEASTTIRPDDIPVLENWARSWYLWVSAAFLKSYLEMVADSPILPRSREGVRVILDAYLLDKAIYEINYELNNRPDWVGLPLQGILQVLRTGDEPTAKED